MPRNFGEDGISFNGLSRRNLAEGCILAVATGYPIVFHLPVDLSLRIILLCFISLPLFFVGLVGYGGESLSQFLVTVVKFLFRRRCLRYYIDAGEPEPEKKKGLARLRSFLKPDKDAIRYQKPKRKVKKPAGAEPPQKESRRIHNMAQEFFPVEDIRDGMIITKDKRYIKVVEVQPINFLLRSASEQRDIILSFGELLRIAPVKIQFKSNANRADITKFLANTVEEMGREIGPACVEMDRDYLQHIQSIATNNAISRRFFAIFEYENPLPVYHPSEKEVRFALESVTRNFRSYLSRCGNSTVEFTGEAEENEFLLQLLFTLLDHYNAADTTLQDKIDRAFQLRLAGGNLEEMCTADYACPDDLDFRHARYVVIDGVYHAYLQIPSTGFKTLVGAAWLSPLINAGEAIDVDLFLHKMPADRMQVQVSRNLRLNKAKLGEVSSTSADFNKMGDIMESGYYLQRGLNDGQEFYYLNVLVTVKAFSRKDLENRVSEVVKMMTAKQITLKYCAYLQEEAFLSTLPLAKLSPKLYRLGRRNVLTNTAASTYSNHQKTPRVDRSGITEAGDENMLHNEARELLVQGYEATHDVEGIAKAYSVSKWTVYRLVEQKRKTGSVALRTSQRGRKPVLTAEDKENIQHCMDESPDITIEEIREKLNLSASYSTVERAIAAMGYTLKKKSLYASERDRVRCAGKAQRMERNHNA